MIEFGVLADAFSKAKIVGMKKNTHRLRIDDSELGLGKTPSVLPDETKQGEKKKTQKEEAILVVANYNTGQ